MANRWTHSNKATFNIGYHLIWCPKYRRKVLIDDVEKRLRVLLTEIATSIDCSINTMEIMPDHIHIFIKCSPIHSPHFVVQQLKGRTSRILRSEFPKLKTRLPTLWTRSYFAESVGHISEETVKNYIQNQKNK
jgi:putative transposase